MEEVDNNNNNNNNNIHRQCASRSEKRKESKLGRREMSLAQI